MNMFRLSSSFWSCLWVRAAAVQDPKGSGAQGPAGPLGIQGGPSGKAKRARKDPRTPPGGKKVTRERRAIKEIRDLQVFGRCKLMERKVVTRVKRWFSILSARRFARWCQMRKWPHCWSLFEKTADELTKKSTMNVSWTDVNYVQEAGDYSFRDGTISVTFVEAAIWKNNPGAQFLLMRKHPIRGSPRYVVGRRVEEGLASENSSLIYASSNGDSWFLTRDPVTGAAAVMHSPNTQSGGQASYVEIEKFLSEGANGPEHQALRHLIETSAARDTRPIEIVYRN
jgi:hypothetical protein